MNEEYLLAIEKRNNLIIFCRHLCAPYHSLNTPRYGFSTYLIWRLWDCRALKGKYLTDNYIDIKTPVLWSVN